MSKVNKDGIGNTIEVKDFDLKATASGAQLTIKGPYETVVVNFTRDQLEDRVNQSFVLEARNKIAERTAGNEQRWFGEDRSR